MSKEYSISSARSQLPSLVRDAERGLTVKLTRWGRPVAVIVSIHQYEGLVEAQKNLWTAIEEFRRTTDLEGMDVDELYADVRDRSSGREVDL